MNQTIETATPYICNKTTSLKKFVVNLLIAMRATSKEPVNAMKGNLEVIPDPGEFANRFNEHDDKLK